MAESILNTIFGKVAFKIVDESFDYPRWTDIKILGVDLMLSAAVADQPLSTQQNADADGYISLFEIDISNGKVIQPVKIRVRAICPTLSSVEGLMMGFIDNQTTYSITSRSIISSGMYMTDLQLTQSADNISSTEVVIEWEQSQIESYDSFDPDNPANESRYGIRIQQPESGIPTTLRGIGDQVTSGASALYNKVTSFL